MTDIPPPASAMVAPVAPARPHPTTRLGITLDDPYHWLRDPAWPQVQDPEIIAYLEAENRTFDAAMAPVQPLVATLTAELKGRIEADEAAAPWPFGAYLYWWAYAEGSEYRSWYRRPKAGGPDQLLLSEAAEAANHAYFRLGLFQISPDGRWLAWSADFDGSERFTLRICDLESGTDVETVAGDALGNAEWSAGSDALLWTQASPEWRAKRAFLHRRGAGSTLIWDEPDEMFTLSVGKTGDGRHLLLTSGAQVTNEVRFVPAADPLQPLTLMRAARDNVQYQVDGRGDTLFILTNDEHANFRLARADSATPDQWQTLITGSDACYLRGLAVFSTFVALEERVDGLDQIRLWRGAGDEQRIRFPEPAYAVELGTNEEFETTQLRLVYSSLVTPRTIFDHDLPSGELLTRKVQTIPSGHDPSRYQVLRLFAPARDGARIPISVLCRKDYPRDGSQPLHVYGYGAYGIAMEPGFAASRLSLVDRGFAYAIAHIRGGDEMGHRWYLDGKLEKRENTFNDFVDATRFLNRQGFGRAGYNSASGGSAGGWLMGAVVNQAPELWRAIVAHVPFVDIVNTMCDASLPLTPGEWPEWGDPRHDKTVLERLIALSPYEQTVARHYPAMLVTGGLHDPRVTYWEPAKWVARLRSVKQDDNLLLMKMNMGAGHGGKSGRYERLGEVAEEQAFILMAFGIEN